jgi:hypothetical protein
MVDLHAMWGLTYITHSQRSALLPNDELNGDL